ncbi:LytTR family DNA-binding domain-containing protein [Limibacter armeniacum]|uniref:LytR/AlgR family response regulator transcription factor n=1 Tax=Limibacter armeniacum TaxID=466084 RepID=UPI002FE5B19C
MRKIQCLIIDDEELAREGIAEYVTDVPFLNTVCTCESAIQAQQVLLEHKVDLIFLDINMPRISGLDFLKMQANPPMVIITTAYPQYALEGYELNVLDYLVKPIPFERFLKAVNKAYEQFELLHKEVSPPVDNEDYIFIKEDFQYRKIKLTDIQYVEAQNNYIRIITTDGEHQTLYTLKEIEKRLPEKKFLRVQKSFIVNIKHVDAVEGNMLMVGDTAITMSRSLKQEVMDRIFKGKYVGK